MMRLELSILIAAAFAVAAVPATKAQDAAKPPSMAGKVITKKKLAECKQQAKDQKSAFRQAPQVPARMRQDLTNLRWRGCHKTAIAMSQ